MSLILCAHLWLSRLLNNYEKKQSTLKVYATGRECLSIVIDLGIGKAPTDSTIQSGGAINRLDNEGRCRLMKDTIYSVLSFQRNIGEHGSSLIENLDNARYPGFTQSIVSVYPRARDFSRARLDARLTIMLMIG